MTPRPRCPARCGHCATVLPPYPASRARARVINVFVATSINATVSSVRLRRGLPRRRTADVPVRPPCSLRFVGKQLCHRMPFRPGCPKLRESAPPSSQFEDPAPVSSCTHSDIVEVGKRWSGGGVNPASPGPGRGNWSPVGVLSECSRDSSTRGSLSNVSGWTPDCPPLGIRCAPSGAFGQGHFGYCSSQWRGLLLFLGGLSSEPLGAQSLGALERLLGLR